PLLDTAVLCGGVVAEIDGSVHSDLLSQVIEGSVRLAFAHGEPGSRYDLDRVTSMARADESGIILHGRKSVVFDAGSADHFIVSAREGDRGGISLFLVPAGCSGLTVQSYPVIGGARAGEVTLDNLRLPETARLGLPGTALPYLETAAARANVAVMADTLGAMETVTDMTREYLMTRQQFGRPIGTFQALQHRFADMLIELEQARSAVINAAGHLDHPDRDRQISASRNLICRTGRLIAEESMQMHGGIAMTQEYDLAGFAKRIIMAEHRFGDADFHLERFIALGTV
ncbi:MAG: acyl-CoA dehydrogenase, partial [Pseudomonadota bacterium]